MAARKKPSASPVEPQARVSWVLLRGWEPYPLHAIPADKRQHAVTHHCTTGDLRWTPVADLQRGQVADLQRVGLAVPLVSE